MRRRETLLLDNNSYLIIYIICISTPLYSGPVCVDFIRCRIPGWAITKIKKCVLSLSGHTNVARDWISGWSIVGTKYFQSIVGGAYESDDTLIYIHFKIYLIPY